MQRLFPLYIDRMALILFITSGISHNINIKHITLRTIFITEQLEAIMTKVGKKNPRDMRNQLYEIPKGVYADQWGAQLEYKIQ